MPVFKPQLNGKPYAHALGKIVCVGRNYAAHAAELNNPIPTEPILFMKPASAACDFAQPLRIPHDRGSVHHETELAILIGAHLSNADAKQAQRAIAGIGIALDLTLRDLQDKLKKEGQPWERAKAFDGAYPISHFIDATNIDLQNLSLQLYRNDHLQQDGNTSQMLFGVVDLIVEISKNFSLQPGDIVSTGTPAGVGPLQSGDRLVALLGAHVPGDLLRVETSVV
ncbi:MAG TPA: fumarylacetoacetate hydrolase family protein [Spongiibacteraceae bacterium]|nr:fumarylacetoacetate hydrolase family protein [Spongiibacteraceae bacterium]